MRRLVAVLLALVAPIAAVLAWRFGTSAVEPTATGAQGSADPAELGSAPLGDEFDGADLDSRSWSTCYFWRDDGCTNEWNDELQAYQPANVRVVDGNLELVARAERTTGHRMDGTPETFAYSSGMVSSHDGFTFRYGFVEVRARVPAGQGLWPALWLLAADRTWPPEIDIVEVIGDEPEVAHMTLHAADGSSTSFSADGVDLSADWHTYAVDWRPGSLRFYVDGVLHGHVQDGVPDEPMYFIANLAVGGEWPGPPGPDTTLPATFSVDHVRIWPGKTGPPPGHPLHGRGDP